MDEILFSDGERLIRTIIIGTLAYINLVVLLRLSGRRTLSKMNAFDLVVTVALGSTFATIILNRDVSLAQGTVAFALLIALQYAVTWSSVRSSWFRKCVTGEPAMLFYDGKFLSDAMRRSRVTEDEVRSAARASGHSSLHQVHAVVLETDGTFSVTTPSGGVASALSDITPPVSIHKDSDN